MSSIKEEVASADCKRPSSISVNFNAGEKKLLKADPQSAIVIDGDKLYSQWSEQFIVEYNDHHDPYNGFEGILSILADLGLLPTDVLQQALIMLNVERHGRHGKQRNN